jgi:Ca2+-transporting ATPase
MDKILWHAESFTHILERLKTSRLGLTTEEATKRLKKYGRNILPEEKKIPAIAIFFGQFKSPLSYVLFGAAIISLLLMDYLDAVIILVTVFINIVLGFYQENKANSAVTFLKKLVDLKTKVMRDGHEIQIDAKDLAVGDIIFLESGNKIPADARLISLDNFQVIEATLTGESTPSNKINEKLDRGTVLADRENMVYSGTIVARGKAIAVVCATGIDTELGQITKLVKETKEEKTPLQLQLNEFSKYLTYFVIIACLVLIIFGHLQGRPIFGFGEMARDGMLNTAAAIAVAAIPEGLLITVTVMLSIGMQSILKRKVLVRKLIATETLGNTSIICTDKTGTLTEGKMQVSHVITLGDEIALKESIKYDDSKDLKDHELIIKISLLCNNAIIENPEEELANWKILGDPTETALLLASIQSGVPQNELKKLQPRLAELPFDSEKKYMATLNKLDNQKNVIYIKGAPEKILNFSNEVRINGKREPLNEENLKKLKLKYEKLTRQGLRILGFAYKQISNTDKIKDVGQELNNMTFIGFVALKDPLRAEAKETLAVTREAGIRTIIVTGDHRLTAKAIFAELGLKVDDKNILEGEQLDKMSDKELEKRVKDIDIYARVEPKHKLRIVNAWLKKGEVVAMTGDGINDAPALKAADIGIALGSGTDVAKETSDLILLDNNFRSIVGAIEQGRIIYDNIRKAILYLISDSFAEIILIGGAMIMGLPLPILPAQIIWVNLVCDGLPNVAMTFEPGERGLMQEKPRKRNAPLLNQDVKMLVFIIGILTNFVLFGLFYLLWHQAGFDLQRARTFIFTSISISSLLYVFSCRNLRHSFFKQDFLSNKFLLSSILIGIILQCAAVYEPHLQKIFETIPLRLIDWIVLILLAVFNIIAIEIFKYFFIVKKYQYAK